MRVVLYNCDAVLSQEQLVEKVQQAVKCREAAEAEMARVRMIMGSTALPNLEERAKVIWAMPRITIFLLSSFIKTLKP